MILLFVPETRYHRIPDPITVADHFNREKTSSEAHIRNVNESLAGDTGEPQNSASRSMFQGLKPWSGINKDVSFLNLMLRPLPLALYPACVFAFLGCKCAIECRSLTSDI